MGARYHMRVPSAYATGWTGSVCSSVARRRRGPGPAQDFRMVDGQRRQQVGHEELLEFVVTPLTGEGERNSRLHELVTDEVGQGFDLERGPVLRVRLVEMASQDVVLVLTMHHIASDGWSVAVLLREMIALYRGRPSALGCNAGLPLAERLISGPDGRAPAALAAGAGPTRRRDWSPPSSTSRRPELAGDRVWISWVSPSCGGRRRSASPETTSSSCWWRW